MLFEICSKFAQNVKYCSNIAQSAKQSSRVLKMQNSAPNSKKCLKGVQSNRERPKNDHFEMPSWIYFVLVQFKDSVLIKFIKRICYS